MMKQVFLAVLLVPAGLTGQKAHTIPFASSGNGIELTVANQGAVALGGVAVKATNVPDWLRFAEREKQITLLKAGQEMAVLFTFGVEKWAPVGEAHIVQFAITAGGGERWVKEITLAVSAPERLELFQNYPNPFNPVTVIGFELPASGRVRLRVFDLLGREVAMLLDEERPAGHHEVVWDASGYSSGMYVYELTSEREGSRRVARKAMVLVR